MLYDHLNGKSILITGVNGMLGRQVLKQLFLSKAIIYGSGRKANPSLPVDQMIIGDVTDQQVIDQITNHDFDAIIHCVANVNLNNCETDQDYTFELHVNATRKLAKRYPNARFVYISTDSVYDGDGSNYLETDPVEPKNYYAQSKLEGEDTVRLNSANGCILRTNFYGFNDSMGGSLFEWAYKSLSENIEISGFTNVIFNPLYSVQLAKLAIGMTNPKIVPGTYNTGGDTPLSKYEFIIEIAKLFNLNSGLVGARKATNDMFTINRPNNTTMNIRKLKSHFPDELFSFQQGLRELHADFNNRINIDE